MTDFKLLVNNVVAAAIRSTRAREIMSRPGEFHSSDAEALRVAEAAEDAAVKALQDATMDHAINAWSKTCEVQP